MIEFNTERRTAYAISLHIYIDSQAETSHVFIILRLILLLYNNIVIQ